MGRQRIPVTVAGGLAVTGALCAGAVVGALFTAALIALTAAVVVSRSARRAVRSIAVPVDYGQLMLAPALSRRVFDKDRRLQQLRD